MLEELMMKMIEFDSGDPKRIQHFIKVHSFSKLIGEKEGLDAHTLYVLEAASILHDIGIRVSEEKYGFQNGKLQEQEGPAPAREICTSLGFKEEDMKEVAKIIASAVFSSDNEVALKELRAKSLDLCKKHPLYN